MYNHPSSAVGGASKSSGYNQQGGLGGGGGGGYSKHNPAYNMNAIKKNPSHCLGVGARGAVFQGFNEETGQLVAIKEMTIGGDIEKLIQEVGNEIDLMKRLDHPNLVKYYGVRREGVMHPSQGSSSPSKHKKKGKNKVSNNSIAGMSTSSSSPGLEEHRHHQQVSSSASPQGEGAPNSSGSGGFSQNPTIQIVLEYVSGGSLGGLVKRYGKLRESVARQYTKDILVALRHLHDVCRVCHRDIKPENVLLSPEGRCKLADFGASKILNSDTSLLKSCVGTPWYMAPEVIQGVGYHFAADIWGVGATVYEMLSGSPPFHDVSNPMAVMFRVGSNENLKPELPSEIHCSEEARDFLEMCFVRDVKQRPTAADLLAHPWIEQLAATSAGASAMKRERLFSVSAARSEEEKRRGQGEDQEDESDDDDDEEDEEESEEEEEGEEATEGASKGGRSAEANKNTNGAGNNPGGQGAVNTSPEEDHNDFADFFPGKVRGGPLDFTRLCQRCSCDIAIFSCDECLSRSAPNQLCANCWEEAHSHPRAASHIRAPLLLPKFGVLKQNTKGMVIGSSPSKAATATSNSGGGGGPNTVSASQVGVSFEHSDSTSGTVPGAGGLLLANGDFVDMFEGEQSEWTCGKCGYVNDGPAPECEICGNER